MSNDLLHGFPPEVAAAVSRLRENSIGRLLLRASRQYNETAIERVRALGHPDLTITHASILPHIDLEGTRLTEVAKRAGLTKQSASELLLGLERLGYLGREPDPDDRRAQLIVFTARGRDFLMAAYQAKTELEREFQLRLGAKGSDQLVMLLRGYLGI